MRLLGIAYREDLRSDLWLNLANVKTARRVVVEGKVIVTIEFTNDSLHVVTGEQADQVWRVICGSSNDLTRPTY